MIFIGILNLHLEYVNFKADIKYDIPWMNNTQHAEVAFNSKLQLIKYAFLNASNQISDITAGGNTTYKYGRTAMNEYQCFWYNQDWADTMVPFVPVIDDSQGWYQLDNTVLLGTPVQHYRIVEDYVADGQEQQNMNYTEVRTYQQDFYCQTVGQNCVPKKWYMQSKSNFQSHYDIYIIYYEDFEFATEESDFAFQFYDSECPEQPYDPDDPNGPTAKRNFMAEMQIKKAAPKSEIVSKNLEKISRWRQNKHFTFNVAPNHLIDKEYSDIIRTRTGKNKRPIVADPAHTYTWLNMPFVEDLPELLDWRVKGVMTYAKDQLFCGSCWSFAAIGCLESRINVARVSNNETTPLITLSEQQVVDCFWRHQAQNGFGTSLGCEGGDEDDTMWQWAQDGASAFATEHDYPYFGQNDYCKTNLNTFTDYKVTAWSHVPPSDIVQMKRALMNGPVSIAIAVPETFVYYAGGVYNDPACNDEIDHAVLAIGWGESEFGPYWIVRNSWSPLWGQDGYIYIAMKDNLCSVLTDASYVTVAPTN